MKPELTKRADYAIRAMLALARADRNTPLSTRRIADDRQIPSRFLSQVMRDLGRANLVQADTGRNGGYRLGRPSADISLLDVIEAIEGDSRRRSCVLRGSPCGGSGFCDVHDVFFAAQDALLGTLGSASLAAIVAATAEPADRPTAGRPRR